MSDEAIAKLTPQQRTARAKITPKYFALVEAAAKLTLQQQGTWTVEEVFRLASVGMTTAYLCFSGRPTLLVAAIDHLIANALTLPDLP